MKRLQAVRAVVVAAMAVAGGAGLVLPSAQYLVERLPPGVADPDLGLGLRLACALAMALAFALALAALQRHQDKPLAFACLPGIAVTGIAAQYLVLTLPRSAEMAPAARIEPASGAWVLLGVGLVLTVTGLVAGAASRRSSE
ncbi:hypothetical protein OG943_02390 [Amycolatopsis sp. NBC_00345]|uniref:hypothetical protein n=1 Tax=Amycolatopsis sp. NBC_00345 TaxID=2975955 RepID=UPI002E2570F2